MKPFDLEAAKRGEPFEYRPIFDPEWRNASLIGIDRKGHIHGEFHSESGQWLGFSVAPAGIDALRMATRPVVFAIELWRDEAGIYTAQVVNRHGVVFDRCRHGEKIETIPYTVHE